MAHNINKILAGSFNPLFNCYLSLLCTYYVFNLLLKQGHINGKGHWPSLSAALRWQHKWSLGQKNLEGTASMEKCTFYC